MKRSSKILALLLALSLSGAPVSALAAASAAGARAGSSWRNLLVDGVATLVPVGLLRLVDGAQAVSAGNDGRLTFLLLGSDTRGGGVARTDTIMVMSLRGKTISALSIPRDVARIPNPDGGTFSGRVNAILKQLRNGRTPDQALAKFEQVIEHLLQIEIDYYALVKFNGFQALVEEIEPVTVNIRRQIRDARFWDDPNKPSGVYFPAATDYDLYGYQQGPNPLCNGLWRFQSTPIPSSYWCRRAMPFVRSRKSASDFVRARRQQDFVIASTRRVINRGSGGALSSLVSRANGEVGAGTLETNIPLNASTALDLYQRLSGASVGIQVVLAPRKYATHIPGGTAYELNLAEVRQLTRQWFGGSDNPQVPPATTLPTAPPPGATVEPTSGPTAVPSALPTAMSTALPTASSSGSITPGPTTQPTTVPIASAGATSQPTPTLVAGLSSPPPVGSASAAPIAVVPAPSPSPAVQPQSAPLAESGLPGWVMILAVVLLGLAALSLLWRGTRQVP